MRTVRQDLQFFLIMRENIRNLFFEVCTWPYSFKKTSHKVFNGRLIYLLSLAFDELQNRSFELVTHEGDATFHRAGRLAPDVQKGELATPLQRKEFLLNKVSSFNNQIKQYVLESNGMRDEPSILSMASVQRILNEVQELTERADKDAPFEDDLLLVFDVPNRDPDYQVIPSNEAQIAQGSDLFMRQQKLHQIALCVEITAIEICSTMILDYPEMPWEFHKGLARQCYDESRHTAMLIKRVTEMGGWAGMLPIHHQIWESSQIGETLAERIAIQQVVQEGHGLDSDILFTSYMRQEKDPETAAIFDYITADEVLHVRFGCRWLLYACNGDKEKAHQVLDEVYERLISNGYKPKMPIQTKERLWAGMTLEQIEKAKEVVHAVLNRVSS